MDRSKPPGSRDLKKAAFQLIILFGLVSLFGDIVYEGARSVNGPYLKTLGANAAAVGLVAGMGEFLGYAIRLLSGYYADRTKAYWIFTLIGYGALAAVPLLALTGIWQTAAIFIVMERIGKGVRSPAKDTIVSQAAKQVGTGFGFGLQEAMDQIGAIAGPLIFTGLFMYLGKAGKTAAEYQKGYWLLWVPFALTMLCVVVAYLRVPNPDRLEAPAAGEVRPERLSKAFWLYNIFTFVTTLGFVNFVLISYHFKARGVLSDAQIPLMYAAAMGVDGAAALFIGKIYDNFKKRRQSEKGGLATLLAIPILSLPIPILAFSHSAAFAAAGVICWGVVMGIHETIMKSAIADITPLGKRGSGYGVFNATYGLAMFIGSALMGILYDISIPALIAGAIAAQIIAAALFYVMRHEALSPFS